MYHDITYNINENMAIYPGDPKFQMTKQSDINNGGDVTISELKFGAHTGTHVDAPSHFIKAGGDITSIPPEKLCGKAKVINITNKQEVTIEELTKHTIEKDDIILFKTTNSKQYNGTKLLSDYCTLNDTAAQYLVGKQIKAVGIDYLTIEPSNNPTFSIHTILLKNNIPILEGLKLKAIPEGVYELIALPLNIDGCEASPVRAVLKE